MLGTLISLIIGGYVATTYFEPQPGASLNALSAAILIAGVLIGLILPFLYANVWSALQRAELKATPRVTELFHSDKFLFFARIWCLLFPLLAFFIAIDLTFIGSISKPILLAAFTILLGITLDVIYHVIKKISGYLSPTLVVKQFTTAAKRSIQEESYGDLCAWIDAISEVGLHATYSMRLSLCMQSLDDIQEALRHFLNASKSISHHVPAIGGEEGKSSQPDTVSYVLLFAFQRLEMINEAACRMKLEPVSSYAISVLGKVALDAAKYDITTAQYPLHYMGRLTRQAVENGLSEVSAKATSALLALSKTLPSKVDLTYLEIAPFYTGIVGQLDENAKSIFRKDKTISINVLLQPFQELKTLFENKLANHQDTPTIKTAIDNVVNQYKTLEEVMQSMVPFNTTEGPSTTQPLDDEGLSSRIVDDLEQRLRKPDTENNDNENTGNQSQTKS